MKLRHMLCFDWSWLLAFVAPVGGAFVYIANVSLDEVPWFWAKYGMAAHFPTVEAIMATAILGLVMIFIALGLLRYHLFRDSDLCDRCAEHRNVIMNVIRKV